MAKKNHIKNTLEMSVSNRSIQNTFLTHWINQNKPTPAQQLGDLLGKSYELSIQGRLN